MDFPASQVEMVLDHSHTLLVMLGIYAHKITYSIYVEHIMTNDYTSNFRTIDCSIVVVQTMIVKFYTLVVV